MIKDIACVILAGGKSSRMGRDKALLPFGGYNSLAEYQYDRMKKIFDKVYISAKEDKFDFDCPLIFDKYSEHSPLHALASIFETIDSQAIFLLAVDMPFFDSDMIEPLVIEYSKNKGDIVCYKTNNYEPLSAIYSNNISFEVHKMIEKNIFKLQILLSQVKISVLNTQNINKLANLNHYSDYLKSLL